MGKFVIGKITFLSHVEDVHFSFRYDFPRERKEKKRGREGLRGEDCDSACDGHVYPGKGGKEGGLLLIDPGSFFDGCRITNCCRTSFSNSRNRGQVAGKR